MKMLKSGILLLGILLTVHCSCSDKNDKGNTENEDQVSSNNKDADIDKDSGAEEDASSDKDAETNRDAESDKDAEPDRDARDDNQTPIAESQHVTTDEDTAIEITLVGTDPDEDALRFTILSEPTHGNLSGNDSNITYTPDKNFNGEDEFTFAVDDGENESDAVTVTITVEPVNDTPIAEPQSITVVEDTALDITLSGSDIDGDVLQYSIQKQPDNGSLDGSGIDLIYRPVDNFNGNDSFTFLVDDGTAKSETVEVDITVVPVNDIPSAEPQTLVTDEDIALDITLNGFDVEGDSLTYTIRMKPNNGKLNGSGKGWLYHPDNNFNGMDSFTFSVNDGNSNSDAVTVSITVKPINDAPVATTQTIITEEESPIDITLDASDIDGDLLDYTIQSSPENGVLTGTGSERTYNPSDNFNGEDSFTFVVNDGSEDSATVTVFITVSPVNDAPVVEAQAVTTNEDSAIGISLIGNDVDEDELIFRIQSGPQNGNLTGFGGDRVYTPNPDFNGEDSFTFLANDGTTNSIIETVSISILPVNDPPFAHNKVIKTEENTAVDFTLIGTDTETSTLTYTVIDGPNNGTLTGATPDLTYTPDTDFKGKDLFTFVVNDGELDSEIATVRIVVGLHIPNVLLIIGDDMGFDTTTNDYPGFIENLIGIYNNVSIEGSPASTPVLRDRIFGQGISFGNVWGQQTCSPMRASAFTGLFGNKTNVGYASSDLTPHQINMAQLLRDNGYSTGMFGKWHLGQDNDPSKPCDVGFEVFKGNLEGGIRDFWSYTYQVQSLDIYGEPTELINSDAPEVTITINGEDITTTYAPAVKVVDTMNWISAEEAENPDKPWFAWLAFNTPHTPLHEPEDEFLDEISQGELATCRSSCPNKIQLRGMINAMDTVVGVLLDEVEALDPNTVVIFVGDNGTVSSTIDNMYLTTSGRGKTTNYESGIRIPMAITGPAIQQGQISTEFVHVVDLFATVLELAGLEPPAVNYAYYDENVEIASDSVSLLPILQGEADIVRDQVFDYILSERFTFSPSAAARNGTYKIICWDDSCSEHVFYDLINDPLEEYPLDTDIDCSAIETTPTEDSLQESFCRLKDVILTESYFSR